MLWTGRFIITPLLIFELVFAPFTARTVYAVEENSPTNTESSSVDPALTADLERVEGLAQAIENSADGSLPPTGGEDAFKITRQTLKTPKGEFELSRFNSALPEITITDFDAEVSVELGAQDLTFVLTRKNNVLARQTIEGIRPISYTRDTEIIVVLDADGKTHVIDLKYARKSLFKGPLPIFELKRLESVQNLDKLSLSFLSRDSAVPANAAEMNQKSWAAGDLLVVDTGTGKLVEILARNVIQTQMYTGEAVLGSLAFLTTPDDEAHKVAPAIVDFQRNTEIAKELNAQLESTRDPLITKALSALTTTTIQNLLNQSHLNHFLESQLTDRFSIQEWQEGFQQALITAREDQVKLAETEAKKRRPVLEKILHPDIEPKKLRRLAIWTVGGLATCTAAFCGSTFLAETSGGLWAIYTANQLYNHYMPELIKNQLHKINFLLSDASYRKTLAISSVFLSSFVPILALASTLGAKLSGKKDVTFKTQFTAWGMRINSVLMLQLYHRLAQWTGKESITQAARLGLNPLKYNTAEAMEQAHLEKGKKHALAWKLALIAVSQQTEIDPATLTLLTEQTDKIQPILEALAKDPNSAKDIKEWQTVAEELAHLLGNEDITPEQIKSINPELLQKYYQIARETAEKIRTQNRFQKVIGSLKNKWRHFGTTSLKTIGGFGLEEYHFLKNADPTQFTSDVSWRQFAVDYLANVAQVALIGDRADPKHPDKLAADPNGPLGSHTNGQHMVETVDQVRIYFINATAQNAFAYNKSRQFLETKYLAAQEKILEGKSIQDGFFRGLWGWLKGMSDLEKADYAKVLIQRGLMKIPKMLQVNLMFLIPARIWLAGADPLTALAGFTFMTMWSVWGYGWIWQPLNLGTQNYEEANAANKTALVHARIKIDQGIRLKDNALMRQGLAELLVVYNPKITNEEYQKMLPGDDVLEEVAKRQLESSLEEPHPSSAKTNELIKYLLTGIGAVSTTYLGTQMSITSFRGDLAWGPFLAETALISGALYTGTWLTQKALVKVTQRLRAIRQKHGSIFRGIRKTCSNLLSPR